MENYKLEEVEGIRTLFIWVDDIRFWYEFEEFLKHLTEKTKCLFPDTKIHEVFSEFKSADVINFLSNVQCEFIADNYIFKDKYPDKRTFEAKGLSIGRVIFMPDICNIFDSTTLIPYLVRSLSINFCKSNPDLLYTRNEEIYYKIINTVMYFNKI